eukprot:g1994.t1
MAPSHHIQTGHTFSLFGVQNPDRQFVAENFAGLLLVHLQSASDLPSKDILGKSDPYVMLSVDGSSATSSIKAQTLDPVWDETYYLYIKNRETAVMTIRLFDADTLKPDDALGVAKFPLRKISFDESVELEVALVGDGGGGMLYATIQLLPFESVDEMGSIGSVDGFTERELEDSLPRGIPALEMSDAWRVLARMAGKRAEEQFDPICFIENPETDTQVWMYQNSEKKECVIAFRGTEQIKWKDLMTDANISAANFDVERTSLKDSIISTIMNQKSIRDLLVHRGFLTAYDSVKTMVFTIAELITRKDPNWTVYTTGHSLGGALATLCAFEMSSRWLRKPPKVKMYNFGSPRVGNQSFAENFNQLVSESWRIVSRKDLVTTIPRLAGYCHVQNVVVLNKDGSLEFEDGDRKDVLEGLYAEEIVNEVSAMLNDGDGFEKVGKKVLDYELELVSRLVDGSGLGEHMEENYLLCLKCSIGGSISDESVELEA